MTAAQKTAKLKFKQAIAYRQKTGVTLKEAFAHIYGKKKVGVIKKKAAPKKKVVKKVVRKVVNKKAAPKKKAAKKKIGYSKIRLKQEKGITKVLKNTPRTLFPYTAEEKIVKAGKKYFDQEAKKIGNIIIGKAKPSIISLAKKISKLTDYNDHNKSILSLAKFLKNKNAIDKMNYISKMHDSYGYMPNELDDLRIKILEDLFTMFKNKYGQIDYRLIKDSF